MARKNSNSQTGTSSQSQSDTDMNSNAQNNMGWNPGQHWNQQQQAQQAQFWGQSPFWGQQAPQGWPQPSPQGWNPYTQNAGQQVPPGWIDPNLFNAFGNPGFNGMNGMNAFGAPNSMFGQQPQAHGTGIFGWLGNRQMEQFILGVLLGGAAVYILGDPDKRARLMRMVMKLYTGVAGSFEEFKEQIADLKAEVASEQGAGAED